MSYNRGRAGYRQGDADRVRAGARGTGQAGGWDTWRAKWAIAFFDPPGQRIDLADGRINAAGHHAVQCRSHRASGPNRIRPGL